MSDSVINQRFIDDIPYCLLSFREGEFNNPPDLGKNSRGISKSNSLRFLAGIHYNSTSVIIGSE